MKWSALLFSVMVLLVSIGSFLSVLNVEIHAENSYEIGVGAGRLYVAELNPGFIRPARPPGFAIRRGEDHWDYRPWQATFFLDVPLWPFLVLLVPITVAMFRRDRPYPNSSCRKCGYNLTGNMSGKCPECGSSLDQLQTATTDEAVVTERQDGGKTVFWYAHCPRCGDEGELVIRRRTDTGRLCFRCAECEWTCDKPEDVREYGRGFEGTRIPFETPTLAEIQAAGWDAFRLHEEAE